MKHYIRIVLTTLLFTGTLQCANSEQQPAEGNDSGSWVVDTTPSTVLGSADNETESIAIGVGATRLPDGTIVVADRDDFGLLYFDANGRLLRRLMRKGEGPGEVEFLAHLWRCGTTIFVYDINGYRISALSLDGVIQRTFRFAQVDHNSTPYLSACNTQSEFIHYGWEQNRNREPGVQRPQVAAWTSKGDSIMTARLPDIAGSERWVTASGSRPLGFGKETQVAAGTGALYIGQANTFAIDVFDFNGKHLRTISKPFTPQPIGQTDIAAAIEREVAESGEKWRKSIERDYATMELPTHAPPYHRLLVDSDDYLWVQEFPMAGRSNVTWSVFSPDGTHVTDVSLPSDLVVFEIGRDYILGRRQNPSTDAPEVHLYRLMKGTPLNDRPRPIDVR